jgi:hypothetical protein
MYNLLFTKKSLPMKNLSKLIAVAFTITALFFTQQAKAQITPKGGWMFSIGADAGIPTGNLRISSNLVLGGTARFIYGVTDNFAVTLTSGADHFLSKELPGGGKFNSFGVIPIKAGGRYFFVPSIYVSAEAGVAIEETDSGVGNTKFVLSPAVGWANKHWDVSARYDNLSGQQDLYGFVALRVAYGFAL